MNDYTNAVIWNDYLMEGALSGATMYGTAGGSHAVVSGRGKGTTGAGAGTGSAGGSGVISATHAAAGAGAGAQQEAPILPEKKKIFFDVISKPIAIIGGSVIVLGLGYLLLKPKHKKQTSTALVRA